MSIPRLGGRSLATRVVLSTFALISAAVVLLAVTSVQGVYSTVQELAQAQIEADCQALATSIRIRFGSAADVLDGIASARADGQPLSSATGMAGLGHFGRLVLLSPEGKTLSSYPMLPEPPPVPEEVLRVTSTFTTFVHIGTDASGESVVWAARKVSSSSNELVAGSVRMGFVSEIVDHGAMDADRLVRITCEQGSFLSGESSYDAADFTYDPDRGVPGRGEVHLRDGRSFIGRYRDVEGVPGLECRVAVLESRVQVLQYARTALTPAALVGLAVAVVAVLGVAVSTKLLVAPMRELERRAQRAASGAYVRPIETARQDEVGLLAGAFNDLTKRLNALHDISRLLGSASRTDQVLDSIVMSVSHIAPAGAVAVLLADMVSGDLVIERASEGSPLHVGSRLSMQADRALSQALAACGPVSLPKASACAARHRGECVGIPLGSRGEAFGLLLLWDADRPFSAAEMETLGTFASQATTALRNSRSFEAEYASRLEAEALREVAELLANPGDLASAMSEVGEVAGRLTGADSAVVALWEREAFGLRASDDWDRDHRLLNVMAAAGAAGAGGTIVIEDVQTRQIAEAYRDTDVTSLIVVPLNVGDEPVGCLGLEYAEDGVWYGEARLGLANTIGKQLSLALSNAYLFARAQRKASNLETVFRISQAVGSSLETKVVLDRVLDVVQKIFSADAVSLMTYDATKRQLTTPMARGMISQEILDLKLPPGADIPGDVFEHGHPRMLGRLDPSGDGIEGHAASKGLRSLVAVPLLARGRSIGVLSMFSRETHAFHEEDVELLATFASQAALAIDTANLYGKEHTVASVLQSSIVPDKLPEIPGIEADSVYRPASRDAEIGGDYYDLFTIPDGRIVFAMCDVCGKGVDAATKTSRVKYSIRALAAAGSSPSQILEEVNRIVADAGDSADIVTVIVGVLDRQRGTLTYANGGHPPAMLLPPDSRRALRLSPTGPLLGAVRTARFMEAVFDAPPGSSIVLYTDGVTEARRGNRFFGETRVRRALAGGGGATQVTRRILSALGRFTPGDLRDDVAILVLRIESEGVLPPGACSGSEGMGPRKGRALGVD